MKLLLSSVLLASLCHISSWSVSTTGGLFVTQTSDVCVIEGEAVNITCCYIKQDSERMRFSWFKNQTLLKNNTVVLQSPESEKNHSRFCSNLTFPNITKENSGSYLCKVFLEIPSHVTHTGNGTAITVQSRGSSGEQAGNNNDRDPPASIGIIIVAVVGVLLLLLVALCCFCCLRLKKAQAARVIYEVPHLDSEEAEMDKHSTKSSTGSTQWCQVPVYESFDYFEGVQNKESG